jgi:septum formation protein
LGVEQPSAPLILASASPRRRELLAALGVPFDVRPIETAETVDPDLEPPQAALDIAVAKAVAAREELGNDRCVLTADTVVVLDGRILGKPADAAEARSMLAALADRRHEVYTAVVLGNVVRAGEEVVCTEVLMRPYSSHDVEASIAAGTPFDKAGGYAIQDPLLHPVERFDGCYCNVVGLPLWTVYRLLHDLRPELHPVRPDATYERCSGCPLRQGAERMVHS